MKVTKKFGVIYADPNWMYQNFGAKKHGAARAHYELSSIEDLCKIPVEQWAAKNCILVLCCTWPKLREGFRVAEAWGFGEYVTGIPWLKTSPKNKDVAEFLQDKSIWDLTIKQLIVTLITLIRTGIGFWFQSTSEPILIFRRGKPASPDGNATKKRKPVKGILCGSEGAFFAPIKEHSAKPLFIYDWIRAKLKGPYLELFARNEIHGWTNWGFDTGYALSADGVEEIDTKPPRKKMTPPPPPKK